MPHWGRPSSRLPSSSASQIIEPGWAGTPRRSTRSRRGAGAREERGERVAGRHAPDQHDRQPALRGPRRQRHPQLALRDGGVGVAHHPGPGEARAERLHLPPRAGLEASQRLVVERLLGDGADLERQVPSHVHQRSRARASRSPARTIASGTRCGATLTDATTSSRHDRLAVVEGEDLERIEGVEPGELGSTRTWSTPSHRARGRAGSAWRLGHDARPGDRAGQARGGLVLVQIAGVGLGHSDRLGQPALTGRRHQALGRAAAEARALAKRAPGQLHRPQQDRAAQFVGSEGGESRREPAGEPASGTVSPR